MPTSAGLLDGPRPVVTSAPSSAPVRAPASVVGGELDAGGQHAGDQGAQRVGAVGGERGVGQPERPGDVPAGLRDEPGDRVEVGGGGVGGREQDDAALREPARDERGRRSTQHPVGPGLAGDGGVAVGGEGADLPGEPGAVGADRAEHGLRVRGGPEHDAEREGQQDRAGRDDVVAQRAHPTTLR